MPVLEPCGCKFSIADRSKLHTECEMHAKLRKDAERWRKASTSRNYGITDYTQFGVRTIHGTLAEEVIDAAMKDQP